MFFELRLRDAILNDIVVHFHYYAIRTDFADCLASDKSKIGKLKLITICTSVKHTRTMSLEFLNLEDLFL